MTEPHRRRSIRLKEYDYSYPGAYFITVCAWNRHCLFGKIDSGVVHLNEIGGIGPGRMAANGTSP
jgi:hypothetical protein